ncbi:response regulator transcription factor [Spirosoma sp. KCTC 42546]|uniref:response regulator n=1 Tax=Spirosoma sp. KCTC 42546 TaxID=2520506 RepID=UPI001159EE71|nr:response regulator transcription factor [Spirosoma sp. KCTC 42546]QDK81579.1 response regulator transcription factor [Spirosoma sp. KCTC 42546]
MENKTSSTTVLIADDHQLFSDGLRTLLTSVSPSYTVIGQVYDGRDVIPVVHTLQPELVLLDINLPHRNGIDIARQLQQEFPRVRVVIITMYTYKTLIEELRGAGVAGYLLKSASPDRLHTCLVNVMKGQSDYDLPVPGFSPDLHRGDLFIKQFSLTPRETELISLMRQGLSTPEMADRLFLSEETIKTHRKNIYFKLGISKLSELIQFAHGHGL